MPGPEEEAQAPGEDTANQEAAPAAVGLSLLAHASAIDDKAGEVAAPPAGGADEQEDASATKAGDNEEGGEEGNGAGPMRRAATGKSRRGPQKCSRCHQPGHKSRSCIWRKIALANTLHHAAAFAPQMGVAGDAAEAERQFLQGQPGGAYHASAAAHLQGQAQAQGIAQPGAQMAVAAYDQMGAPHMQQQMQMHMGMGSPWGGYGAQGYSQQQMHPSCMTAGQAMNPQHSSTMMQQPGQGQPPGGLPMSTDQQQAQAQAQPPQPQMPGMQPPPQAQVQPPQAQPPPPQAQTPQAPPQMVQGADSMAYGQAQNGAMPPASTPQHKFSAPPGASEAPGVHAQQQPGQAQVLCFNMSGAPAPQGAASYPVYAQATPGQAQAQGLHPQGRPFFVGPGGPQAAGQMPFFTPQMGQPPKGFPGGAPPQHMGAAPHLAAKLPGQAGMPQMAAAPGQPGAQLGGPVGQGMPYVQSAPQMMGVPPGMMPGMHQQPPQGAGQPAPGAYGCGQVHVGLAPPHAPQGAGQAAQPQAQPHDSPQRQPGFTAVPAPQGQQQAQQQPANGSGMQGSGVAQPTAQAVA